MDYNDGTALYQKLINDSTITALTTAIYRARIIPESESSLETVNIYPTSFNGGLEYFQRDWSVDCRSENEYTSQSISTAVYNVFNRANFTYDGKTYYTVVSVLGTIPPIDDTDVYNTPVTVSLRRR